MRFIAYLHRDATLAAKRHLGRRGGGSVHPGGRRGVRMQGAPFSREHARLAAHPFCMRGREEALASCCSCPGLRATLAISVGGRRTGNRGTGRPGRSAFCASRAGDWCRAGAHGGWGRRRCRATCRRKGEGAMQEVAMTYAGGAGV